MAIDIFSIPAMSSQTESVFSGAKLTITDVRSSLRIDTIEVLECLKPWFRAGYLPKTIHLKPYINYKRPDLLLLLICIYFVPVSINS